MPVSTGILTCTRAWLSVNTIVLSSASEGVEMRGEGVEVRGEGVRVWR